MTEILLQLLFPRRCPVCEDIVQPAGGLICPRCAGRLSLVHPPTCRRCGRQLLSETAQYCPNCARQAMSFDGGAALLNYNAAAQKSMAAVKYKNRREYLDFYSAAIAGRYGRWLRDCRAEALVPVPVHPSRQRQRGFNQAQELARRLEKYTDIPVRADLLVRVKKTAPQKELGPQQRLRNLREAFALSEQVKRGKTAMPARLILVDDIYTTGSTAEACSRVLKAGGAKAVFVLVICTSPAV